MFLHISLGKIVSRREWSLVPMMLKDQQNENQGKKDRELSVKEAIGGSIRTGVEEWWCEETQRGKKMEFTQTAF